MGLNIEVDEIDHGVFQPPKCEACSNKWVASGLGPIISGVKWHLVKEKKDVIALDSRLRKLGNALRGAHMYGFTNGLSKSLNWRLVDLVIEEDLCEKHQMRMHVTVPGASTDLGGVKVTTHYTKPYPDQSDDSVSGTDSPQPPGYKPQELISLRGYPDLVVLHEMSAYLTLLIAENKKEHLQPKSWRGDVHDSQLGQMVFYVVAHQIRATSVFPYPKPVMGLFMADGNFCTVVAVVNRSGPGTNAQIRLLMSPMETLAGEALENAIKSIHTILSQQDEN